MGDFVEVNLLTGKAKQRDRARGIKLCYSTLRTWNMIGMLKKGVGLLKSAWVQILPAAVGLDYLEILRNGTPTDAQISRRRQREFQKMTLRMQITRQISHQLCHIYSNFRPNSIFQFDQYPSCGGLHQRLQSLGVEWLEYQLKKMQTNKNISSTIAQVVEQVI